MFVTCCFPYMTCTSCGRPVAAASVQQRTTPVTLSHAACAAHPPLRCVTSRASCRPPGRKMCSVMSERSVYKNHSGTQCAKNKQLTTCDARTETPPHIAPLGKPTNNLACQSSQSYPYVAHSSMTLTTAVSFSSWRRSRKLSHPTVGCAPCSQPRGEPSQPISPALGRPSSLARGRLLIATCTVVTGRGAVEP